MAVLKQTFINIGDAIRSKEGSTDLIPVADMARRILDLPSGGTGQLVRYDRFLTPQEEIAEGILRCDGRRIPEAHDALFDALKGDFVEYTSQITGLPNRTYTAFQLVGTKLYAGSGTAATSLIVIDTADDSFSITVVKFTKM